MSKGVWLNRDLTYYVEEEESERHDGPHLPDHAVAGYQGHEDRGDDQEDQYFVPCFLINHTFFTNLLFIFSYQLNYSN